MALYFRCSECGEYFMDMFGEHAKDDELETYMNGPYICPNCDSENTISVESGEYYRCHNILVGAKFGDVFETRDGRQAIYHTDLLGHTLIVEDGGSYRYSNHGRLISFPGNEHLDIVRKIS